MTLGSRTALSGRGSRQFTQASTAVALKPKIETPRVILTEYSFMVSKCHQCVGEGEQADSQGNHPDALVYRIALPGLYVGRILMIER